MAYALADERERFVIASRNPAKDELVAAVLAHHPGAQALVIGYYVQQLERIARVLDAPLITGKTARHERDELYDRFRAGSIRTLCVSKAERSSTRSSRTRPASRSTPTSASGSSPSRATRTRCSAPRS
jgi:DNA excision repair protein ERCC-3